MNSTQKGTKKFKYTKEFKRNMVKKFYKSGMTSIAFADANDLFEGTFNKWLDNHYKSAKLTFGILSQK